MNFKLLCGVAVMALSVSAFGQPALFYENTGLVLAPPAIAPQVDAINFVNRGRFIINFTNNLLTVPVDPPTINLLPYETQNTLNYTNTFGNLLSCNLGFRFERFNSQIGQRQRASSFHNAGVIECGTVNTTNYLTYREAFFGTTNVALLGVAGSRLTINASNVVNPGTINLGFESLLNIKGNSVDLTRATITSEPEGFSVSSGANLGFFFNQGIFDGYWGVGDVRSQPFLFYPLGISPAAFFGFSPQITPVHPVTPRDQNILLQQLVMTNSISYLSEVINFGGSNRTVRAVFLMNTNADVQANVYFPFSPDIAIEFTNRLGTSTNNLYVFDYFGILTNLSLVISGFSGGQTTLTPFNYSIFFNPALFFGLGPPAAPTPIPPGTFNVTATTNQWSAYQALLQPLSLILGDVAGQDLTNLPGRIDIQADHVLDLSRSRISALNFMWLKATNHFVASDRSQISSPYMDLNLRSTNGLLTITNLLAPVHNRPEGDIKLYSARWTNVTTFGITVTNNYHVLFVDARFSLSSPSRVRDLALRSTNLLGGSDQVVISDVMNVTRSVLIDAQRLTIATNEPGSPVPNGAINFETTSTLWPSATPRLQYLTNNGSITAQDAAFFGGSRSAPFYSSNFNEPYLVFVNRGVVNTFASTIWAKTFLNSGIFTARYGSIDFQQGQDAILADGAFLAPNGDISISSSSLSVSNHILQAGGALTLAATDYLDDGSLSSRVGAITNKNTWSEADGFNLLVRPAQGSLLGTTVLATAAPFREVVNRWAAEDYGSSKGGFSNNAAVGRMILDGGTNSQFTFTGTGTSNAIYIDYLELRDFVTNINANGNLSGLNVEPNMVIYYAQAMVGGVSVAERLDFSNDGRMRWVPAYAGFYSSTNVVYPDGSTNALNTALVLSQNLDSDGDGVVNAADSTPVFLVTTASLPDATNAALYSVPLVAFGGPAAAPYSWTLAPGSALPAGLNLSPAGVVSGTPTETGVFAFTVRASVTTPNGVLTADRDLSLTIQDASLALAVALESNSPPGARVSWITTPNSTNYLYFRPTMATGNWQLLTNFVSSTGGAVSVWDPVGNNKTRYYRVQVDSPQP